MSLNVDLDGYLLINQVEVHDFRLRTDANDLLIISMEKEEDWRRESGIYSRIISTHTNNLFLKEYEENASQLEKLGEKYSLGSEIDRYIDNLSSGSLMLGSKNLSFAKTIANIDLDLASEHTVKAYEKFKLRDIEGALNALDGEMLANNLRSAQKNSSDRQEMTMEQSQQLDQTIEDYLVKARFYIIDRQYGEAYNIFIKVLNVMGNNSDNVWKLACNCISPYRQKHDKVIYEREWKQSSVR